MPASALCLVPGCGQLLARQPGRRTPARCPAHQRALDRPREQAKARTWQERQHSLELRRAWVEQHGLVCPGLAGRAPHAVQRFEDLTEHHLVPFSQGGRGGPTMVACRPCNTAQGAKRPEGIGRSE